MVHHAHPTAQGETASTLQQPQVQRAAASLQSTWPNRHGIQTNTMPGTQAAYDGLIASLEIVFLIFAAHPSNNGI
jgi:hypothetical protein